MLTALITAATDAIHRQTEPPGCLVPATWASWSTDRVGRLVVGPFESDLAQNVTFDRK